MIKFISFVLVGGAIGAGLGYFGKCTSGSCPFTANPFRGAGFGALFGLLFAFSTYGNPLQAKASQADSSRLVVIGESAELAALLSSTSVPVLVDFYADWCGPCRRLAPELSAVADLWQDGAKVVKVNVDKHRDLAATYNVSGIPDMRIFLNGVQKEQLVGYRSRDAISERLSAAGGVPGPGAKVEATVEKKQTAAPVASDDKQKEDEMAIVLKVGDKAPSFELKDQNGNGVTLGQFAGRKLLIYFYPKANTPGCTSQSCAVSESLSQLGAAGVAAVGISPDSPEKQKKFDEKYKLGFPLLADEDKTVAEAYGVWGEKSMYGKPFLGIVRSAFLVGEDGTLLAVRYKVSPGDTVPFVQQALKP